MFNALVPIASRSSTVIVQGSAHPPLHHLWPRLTQLCAALAVQVFDIPNVPSRYCKQMVLCSGATVRKDDEAVILEDDVELVRRRIAKDALVLHCRCMLVQQGRTVGVFCMRVNRVERRARLTRTAEAAKQIGQQHGQRG